MTVRAVTSLNSDVELPALGAIPQFSGSAGKPFNQSAEVPGEFFEALSIARKGKVSPVHSSFPTNVMDEHTLPERGDQWLESLPRVDIEIYVQEVRSVRVIFFGNLRHHSGFPFPFRGSPVGRNGQGHRAQSACVPAVLF
jgi:hypothetical protein